MDRYLHMRLLYMLTSSGRGLCVSTCAMQRQVHSITVAEDAAAAALPLPVALDLGGHFYLDQVSRPYISYCVTVSLVRVCN